MMGRPLDLMDKKVPIWKLVFKLAWPAVVEQLLQTIVGYVDTDMVGNIGVAATAAVGVTTSTVWMINGFMNAAGIGYAVQVAHHLGAGDTEKARTVVRQAMLAILALGSMLTVLVVFIIAPNLPIWMRVEEDVKPLAAAYFRILGMTYLFNIALVLCSNILRCAGDMKTPMKYNILTNVINVIGNYFLIYPTAEVSLFGHAFVLPRAGLGVQGAAIATAISITFSGVCMLLVIFKRKSPIQIHLREDFSPQPIVIRQVVRLGIPIALERMTISMGHIASTAMISGLGTVSLAANQLASTGESLCYMPVNGFSMAGTTLVAQHLGADEGDRAYQSGRWAIRLAVLVMIACSAAMYLFAWPIIDIFSNDLQAIALGAAMLRIEAFAEPFQAIGVVIGGILNGAGDNKWPFYISILGMWVVRLPVALLLIKICHWDLEAIWVAMIVDWVVRANISGVRFYRKRWMTVWN